MRKFIISAVLLAPIFFGQPEGYNILGAWCVYEKQPFLIEYEPSWQQIWERFKKYNPDADAVVNFRILDNGTRVFCGDIAKKK